MSAFSIIKNHVLQYTQNFIFQNNPKTKLRKQIPFIIAMKRIKMLRDTFNKSIILVH